MYMSCEELPEGTHRRRSNHLQEAKIQMGAGVGRSHVEMHRGIEERQGFVQSDRPHDRLPAHSASPHHRDGHNGETQGEEYTDEDRPQHSIQSEAKSCLPALRW